MANFKDLLNSRENRKIREVIENGEETIFVYEPTADDVAKIIEFQDVLNSQVDGEPTEVVITGSDMVRNVFPLLTNIDGIESMSDEEIEHVIENPTIALLQVQHVIEIIVTQIYKTVILSSKKAILQTDYEMASLSVLGEIVDKTMAASSRGSEEGARLVNKIEKAYGDVIDLETYRTEEEVGELAEEVAEDFLDQVEKEKNERAPYMDKLEAYKDAFKK